MRNYQAILTAVCGFGTMYFIVIGTAQRYVHFAGVENEIGCATFAGLIGIGGLIGIDYRKLLNGLN